MSNNTNLQRLENITILNYNANGLKKQKALIIAFLARYNIDIACISETHLAPGENLRIGGYNIYRYDRNSQTAAGGVAIIIRRQIKHHLYSITTSSIETVAIQYEIKGHAPITLICAYKQPNKSLINDDFKKIFQIVGPVMLIGDLNSKLKHWGCRADNPSGSQLENLANIHQLQIHCPTDYTYHPFRNDHLPDILDIVITKNFHLPLTQTVITELNSDHLPVLINLSRQMLYVPTVPKLINGFVNWNEFQDLMRSYHISELPPIRESINISIRQLTTNMTEAIRHATIPTTKKPVVNYNIPPTRILEIIKEKRIVRREWQRTRNPFTKKKLNKLTHTITLQLDAHRIQKYNDMLNNLDTSDPGMWKATRRILKKYEELPTLIVDGIHINTDHDKSHAFADYLENSFSPIITDKNTDFAAIVQRYNESHLLSEGNYTETITAEEVKAQIKRLPNRKAPGHDLIPNILLKYLPDNIIDHIKSIFNSCLQIGYFPIAWKKAEILLFPKPGKCKSEIQNYRPISLLPTLSKLFEKIIFTRLQDEMMNLDIIPDVQFGFRANHSATHQLARVAEIIEKGFEDKKYTAAGFLDVARAFDTVWLQGLKYKLHHAGLSRYLCAILISYLEERTFSVRINGCYSSTKPIRAGVPQGGILSPTLFNIYMHDIPLQTGNDKAMYADDMIIITQSYDLKDAIEKLQNSINILQKWLSKWCIHLNANKCETKIFTLKRVIDPPCIIINNKPIVWNQKDKAVKYLGVHLDQRLTWGIHINTRVNQAYDRLKQLYSLINRKTPLRMECTLLLYKALIRSLVTYACPVWSNASTTNIKKIQTLQNKILRIAVDAPWFIRNEQLHDELCIDYIANFIKMLTKNFYSNLNKCPSATRLHIGQRNIHSRIKRKLPQDLLTDESE